MANIKQIIPAEAGWEAVYVRDDATFDAAVKTAASPLVGWALIDDENGDSGVYAIFNYGGSTGTVFDLGPRFLGAVRSGSWADRLADNWEPLAVGYMEEYGEPGAQSEEGGEDQGEGGEPEAPAEGDAKPEGEAKVS